METLFKQDGDFRREFTAEEYAQAELDEKSYLARKEEQEAKDAKRLMVFAKLEALGINEDDLKALGLG